MRGWREDLWQEEMGSREGRMVVAFDGGGMSMGGSGQVGREGWRVNGRVEGGCKEGGGAMGGRE